MPLISAAGRCGPRLLCLHEGWNFDERLHDAQRITKWRDEWGVDPRDMLEGLRELGYTATLRYNCTLNECVKFLEEYKAKKGFIFIDYWDDVGSCDGHWGELKGLDKNGNPWGINPDFPEVRHYTWPRKKLELNWYDYTIDTQQLIEGVAIFAYKEVEPKKERKKKE